MSGALLHGMGDCTPELNCGCMSHDPEDFTTKVRALSPEQGTLDGLLALAAAGVPPEQMRRLASDWAAGRLATDPEQESVTITLPRDVVERAVQSASRSNLRPMSFPSDSDMLRNIADALDATDNSQEADQ